MDRAPIWSEGIIVSQQHFQQWERYYEGQLRENSQLFNPYCWGLCQIDIDENALSQNCIEIRECKLVFQSGRKVAFTQSIEKRLSRSLHSLQQAELPVYIGMARGDGMQNLSGYSDSELASWTAEYLTQADSYDKTREQEVAVRRPHLRLFLGEEDQAGHECIKILVLRKDNSSDYQVDRDFMSTSMHAIANTALMIKLTQLVNHVENELSLTQRILLSQKENASSKLTLTLLCQEYSVLLIKLKQLLSRQVTPPYHYFDLLLSHLSWLSALNNDEICWIEYRHEEMGKSFHLLFKKLQGGMKAVHYEFESTFSIQQTLEGRYHIQCGRLNEYEQVYLQIDGIEIEQSSEFCQQTKLYLSEQMDEVIKTSMPGVPIIHCKNPPDGIHHSASSIYFLIDISHPAWNKIIDAGEFSIQMSEQFKSCQLKIQTRGENDVSRYE